MSILLPTALFSALDRNTTATQTTALATDELRAQFLHFSRGTAVILLFMYVPRLLLASVRRSPRSSYVCSRIFLHNPPGEDNAFQLHPAAPDALKEEERKLAEAEPKANSWVCLGAIVITIAIMAVTAEFLVESVESVREEGVISEECVQRYRHEALLIDVCFRWFGLILLPLVSFAADGAVATVCGPSPSH
jgi:Ca2+:H+ antiporter